MPMVSLNLLGEGACVLQISHPYTIFLTMDFVVWSNLAPLALWNRSSVVFKAGWENERCIVFSSLSVLNAYGMLSGHQLYTEKKYFMVTSCSLDPHISLCIVEWKYQARSCTNPTNTSMMVRHLLGKETWRLSSHQVVWMAPVSRQCQ